VGLLYGYLYTDGDLGRVYGGASSGAQAEAAPASRMDLLGGGRENDRPQYEEYEQGVLRDLMGVYDAIALPPVASSPPTQRHDEHVNTLRSEYKEYKAEALDAFELSVAVHGSFRQLHPAPGTGGGGDDQAQLRATYEWDKRTLGEALQAVSGGAGGGGVVDILVTSKVDSRLAQHYIQKAMTGRHEGRYNLPGQARLTGRSRQRPLLSRCYCARALCMMMEADAAAAVRASREALKRIAAREGEEGAAEAMHAISRCRYENLGSARQVSFFASGFPVTSEQLRSNGQGGAGAAAAGAGAGSAATATTAAATATLPTRFKAAERIFVKELGLPEGSSLIDPKRTFDGDLDRLCEQLGRRFEFAATRQLAVPERDHFLMGLSVGLALSWVASGVLAVTICGLAGGLALLLASIFLGESLVPLPFSAWLRRRRAAAAGANGGDSGTADGDAQDAAEEEEAEEEERGDRGLAALCWGSRLHAAGSAVSKIVYFCVPETLTDTRAMLAWVSQLLGISLGGLLAAAFAAGGTILHSGGSVADFAQRFAYAAA
jgi:hypothetical protein